MGSQEEAPAKAPRLLDQVHQVMRLHHYSLHTERSYVDWIKRYVRFHQMRQREDLAGGEAKIQAFLTDLAVNGEVAPATQNQAMNALVFLYKRVLEVPLDEAIDAVRAQRKLHVPVVLTRGEVARILPLVEGVSHLVVKLLYGSGLRIMEALRLRVKDVDAAMKQITVRSGKGDNYAKVAVMRRCSGKALQLQGAVQGELSITTGCRESEDRRRLAETESWQPVVGGSLPMPASSSPSWPRHRDEWFGDFRGRGKEQSLPWGHSLPTEPLQSRAERNGERWGAS